MLTAFLLSTSILLLLQSTIGIDEEKLSCILLLLIDEVEAEVLRSYFYFTTSSSTPVLDYALHACTTVHDERWKK